MKLRNAPQRTLLVAGVLSLGATCPAHAIVLQQKWVAGQQLAYDVLANGTANIQLPPDANNLLAGLPLDIDLNLQGQDTLDTLIVDGAGTGTVAMRINPLQIKGDMLGQKLLLAVKDGKGAVTINAKAMGANSAATDWNALSDPATAMRITKVGRVEGLVPTKPQDAVLAAPPAGAKSKPRGGMPFDMQGMVGTMLLRALPTLWPDHDVNVGDKWTSEVNLPVTTTAANGTAAPTTGAPGKSLGKFDFVLRGEEEVGGRKTERIGVKGMVDIDEDTATAVSHSLLLGNAPKAGGAGLQHVHQQLSGDLWFDAAAGQVVRGEFDVQSTVTTHAAAPAPTAAQDKPQAAGDSSMSFNGTVQMQLRKVSYASVDNTAPLKN